MTAGDMSTARFSFHWIKESDVFGDLLCNLAKELRDLEEMENLVD